MNNLFFARRHIWCCSIGLLILLGAICAPEPAGAAKPEKKAEKQAEKKAGKKKNKAALTKETTSEDAADGAMAANTPVSSSKGSALPAEKLTIRPEKKAGAKAASHSNADDPVKVAAKIDELVGRHLDSAKASPTPLSNDEDFLRRISLDLVGAAPSPEEITRFGLDTDPQKRAAAIARLLEAPEYSENWARYWRDVIFLRATEQRARGAQSVFENWLAGELKSNVPWGDIVTQIITAMGDIQEDGRTGLLFAQGADANELAAESSRIFLGIQIQCANCHDHPTDRWKRQQFHELAAFFPRVRITRKKDGDGRTFEISSVAVDNKGKRQEALENPERLLKMLDRDGDGKVTLEEASRGPNKGKQFGQLLDRGDENKDGGLDLAELKKVAAYINQPRPGRGEAEHHMPDLQDPNSKGKVIDPVFFLSEKGLPHGEDDLARRQALARMMTSPDNPWFAKAFVNRIWASLVGEGFYMPVDDMGPDRAANLPEVLDVISQGFIASGYDVKWVFKAIANSQTYQRQIRSRDASGSTPLFAAATPSRLRADQLFGELTRVLGQGGRLGLEPNKAKGQNRLYDNSPRGLFNLVFGFDPSTLPDDVTGTVPQALFLMNSPLIERLTKASGKTRLAEILEKYSQDDDALKELYLLVYSREPSSRELDICRSYVRDCPSRQEAFEDVLWGLVNSTEFQTKR